MDPKMFAAFEQSTLTSSKYTVGCLLDDFIINFIFLYAEHKGIAVHMMKRDAVRRKNKQQRKEAEQAEKLKDAQLRAALAENKVLKEQLALVEARLDTHLQNDRKLMEDGITCFDKDGELTYTPHVQAIAKSVRHSSAVSEECDYVFVAHP